MPSSTEPDLQGLLILALHRAIRRISARLLETPGVMAPRDYRLIQHFMRMALCLTGTEGKMPTVQYHNIRLPGAGPLPEIAQIDLVDYLAGRVSDQIPAALDGDATARAAIEAEAEQILLKENIQLL